MNSVVLIGRLTKDPEVRYTDSQMAVGAFTLAVDRPKKKDRQEQTADFIRITTFGKIAENCSRYLSKGRQAAVQGRIQTGSYINKDGQKVYTTDVVATSVEFIGSSKSSGDSGSSGSYGGSGYQQNQPQQWDDIPPGFEEIDNDDVPF